MATKISPKMREKILSTIGKRVEKAFSSESRKKFESKIADYWKAWNAQSIDSQYDGFHTVTLPFAHDAIEACVKRDVATFFPVSNEWVTATGPDQEVSYKISKLLNHHLVSSEFMDTIRIVDRTARVTGTGILYADWENDLDPDEEEPDLETLNPLAEQEVEEGTVFRSVGPENFLVEPITCLSLKKASLVAERRFLDVGMYRRLVEEGVYEASKDLEKYLKGDIDEGLKDILEAKNSGIGLKGEGLSTVIIVVDVFTEFEGKDMLITLSKGIVLRAEESPFGKERPYFGVSRKQDGQSFFGHGDIQYIMGMAEAANDFINQGLDSATYALCPVVSVDPKTSPNYKSFVMEPGAIWTGGSATPLQMPNLANEALGLVNDIKMQIQTTMGLTPPVNIDQGSRKPAAVAAMMQAEIQLAEQDWARSFEQNILIPAAQWILELDQKHRKNPVTTFGVSEELMTIDLSGLDPKQFLLTWQGSRQATNPAKSQQVLTALNILSKVPPQALGGKTLDLSPLLEYLFGTVFALPVADKIISDPRENTSIDPRIENQGLAVGVYLPVHKQDDDMLHIQVHSQLQTPESQNHIQEHLKQAHLKMQAQQQAQMAQIAQAQQRQQGAQIRKAKGAPTGRPNTLTPPEPAQELSAAMGGING